MRPPASRLRRSIQLLPGGESGPGFAKRGARSLSGMEGVTGESYGVPGDDGAKYIHCIEEACPEAGGGGDAEGGVVIEWARRPVVGTGAGTGIDVQEVLVKCRVGQFPSLKGFYLLVSGTRCLWTGNVHNVRCSIETCLPRLTNSGNDEAESKATVKLERERMRSPSKTV